MKRAISFLLAVVMLVGSIPAVAFAEENVTEPDAEIVEQTVAATDATVPEETTAPTQSAVPEETSAPTEEPVTPTEFVEETVAPTEEVESTEAVEPTEVVVSDEAAVAAANIVDSGAWDTSINWCVSSDGVLTISGRGSVVPTPGVFSYPWEKYCDEIKSLVFEEGITVVQIGMFHLWAVTNLSLPASMTGMAHAGFSHLGDLKTVTIASDNPSYCVKDNVVFTKDMSTLVAYPIAKPEKAYSIPDGVSRIENSAGFLGSKNLVELTIPASVTSIGHYAISECPNLKRIIFEGDAPALEYYLFYDLEATVYYPANNETWTDDIIQGDYGGDITWIPYDPETDDKEDSDDEAEYHNTLAELTEVDYLAFAQVAYEDFVYGETVQECLTRENGNKWDDVWGEEGITYSELCEGIAQWKVCCIKEVSKKGFYAVAFRNESGEAVLAYRGSKPLTNLLEMVTDEQASKDWIANDLSMILFNEVTDENQYNCAINAYKETRIVDEIHTVVTTGHSLGGLWGEIASAYTGCEGITFNAISALDILYVKQPIALGRGFRGIDAWNFTDHINVYDILAGAMEAVSSELGMSIKLKPFVAYNSNYSATSVINSHSLKSLVSRDGDKLVLNNSIGSWRGSSGVSGHLASTSRSIDMGISGDDSFDQGLKLEDRRSAFGGDGFDKIYTSIRDDVMVGGRDNDHLDGSWGDDTYYYFKGDGCDTIVDIGGHDKLYLIDFDNSDLIEMYEDKDSDYISIRYDGSTIVNIYKKNRDYSVVTSSSFKVYINGGQENNITEYFSKYKSGSRLLVQCPVSVEILDADGNVVYTLQDGAVGSYYTDYGNFYVFEEENGGYGKVLDLAAGYTARIVGEDTGSMKIEYRDVVNGELSDEAKNFADVPVSVEFTATFEETADGELVLAADTNADGTVDTKLGYDGKPVPVESLELAQEYIALKPGEAFKLHADVKPAELTQFLCWDEEDSENILHVEQDGTVIGQNEGTAYVLVAVKNGDTSITKRCRVDVAQTEPTTEPSAPDEQPVEKVTVEGVQLSTNKVTTELYKSDYATFEILLDLPQNHPYDENEMVISDDAVMAVAGLDKRSNLVDSVRLATINDLFTLEMLDDRTVQIVPTPDALKNGKTLKSSYIDTVIVTVQGVEYPISEKLTLSVKKTMPKLKASIAAFNSFYEGQAQKIVITGGEITGIRVNEDKNTEKTVAIPAWLTLENGSLKLNGETPKSSDKAYIWIDVDGWRVPAELTLSVKHSYKAPTLKLSASSVTLNTLNGDKKDIQITSSFADYVPIDLDITSTAGDALTIENKDNGFVVSTNDQTLPNKTYKVTVKTANPKIRAVTLTVKTVGKNPTMNSLKVKGTMDVTFPENKVTIGVSLKNYADAFVPELTVKDSGGNVVTEQFNTGWNGTEFAITPNTAVKGSYTATVTVNINMGEEDIPLTKTAKLTVKETLPKVKLSYSKVTLNKKLDSSTVIDITSATRGYELEHARVDVTAPEQIKAEYAEGKLMVSLNESAVYGKTYKVTVRAYKGAPAATLSIVVPAERRSNVSAAIKGTGFIDVIRENTAITITPTFTNAYASDMESMELKLYKKDVKVWTDVTEDAPFNVELADGKYIITAEDGLLYTDKYQAELVAKLGDQEIVSKRINLSVKMGSAKLTIKSSDTTLFAKDRNDRALVWFDAADLMLNDVKKIEIKDAKYKDAFRIIDNQDGTFSIDFKDGKIHKNIASLLTKKTSAAITLNLNVFIEGNESTKVNTTQKVKLTIVK